MSVAAPGSILIRKQAQAALRRVLEAALPAEGCALLLGERLPTVIAAPQELAPCWRLRWIWPCLNGWDPPSERCSRFRIDPREQVLAQRWARDRGLLVLGSAHSHPCSAAQPSARDHALAFTPCLQLILSPTDDWIPHCWWLEGSPEGAAASRPLPWKMED